MRIKSTKFVLKKKFEAKRNVQTEKGAALASKPPVTYWRKFFNSVISVVFFSIFSLCRFQFLFCSVLTALSAVNILILISDSRSNFRISNMINGF